MNPTITHPGQPQMQAQVILASSDDNGNAPPIYTIRMRYPRIIHGEFMTHRVFGRNAGSSRARPAKVTIQEVRSQPFIPWHWGKNQGGMQAGEKFDATVRIDQVGHFQRGDELFWEPYEDEVENYEAWLGARDAAVMYAEAFANAGYHKQIFNRLLEPFSWIDVLATATDWDNFLWLRDHEDAEPHIRDLAVIVKQAMDSADVQPLMPGVWHLPYITEEDLEYADWNKDPSLLRNISAARCARISYKPFDSDTTSIEKDLQLYDKLMGSDRVHASPLEHQATPDQIETWTEEEEHFAWNELGLDTAAIKWQQPRLHGNLTGWIQHRKLIPGENYKG